MSFFEFPNSRTYDSDLGWLIKSLKKVINDINSLDSWKITHESEYLELKKLYDEIISGNFPKSITDSFNKWMRENALDLVGELVKCVFFGLTDDGYFVAYIPEQWDEIIFKTTGLDISTVLQPNYGHLVIEY